MSQDSLLDENENSTGDHGGLAKLSVTSQNSDGGGGDARGRARLRKGVESGTSGNMLGVQFPDTRRAKSPVTVQVGIYVLFVLSYFTSFF